MDPNSAHQQWSEWVFQVSVTQQHHANPSVAEVRSNVARFMRKLFGSSSRMKMVLQESAGTLVQQWTFTVQTEAAECLEQSKRAYVYAAALRFMEVGFGPCVLRLDSRILSGTPFNGGPAEQWLIMPPVIMSDANIGWN